MVRPTRNVTISYILFAKSIAHIPIIIRMYTMVDIMRQLKTNKSYRVIIIADVRANYKKKLERKSKLIFLKTI